MEAGFVVRWAVSTLGCPEWDAATVPARVGQIGFNAIEWRGGDDGTVRTSWSPVRRAALRRAVSEAGLASIAVTSYPNLLTVDRAVVAASFDGIEAHVALARDLAAPWVRIFLGVADDDAPREAHIGRAIDGIALALDRTAGSGVGLAIEPHDDLVRAADLQPILAAFEDDRLAVVWDVGNAWAAGEPPAAGFDTYRGQIAWTQVKDGTGRDATWRLSDLGAGDVPIREALELLAEPGARRMAPGRTSQAFGTREAPPVVSLEWERAWDDRLAPPEIAFPASLAWLRSVAADVARSPAALVSAEAADQ
ncbi:MAG TPA: sugar phosphate isomerase/epimerase family protein [Candidatus Limnocylindrales bacterium]|nr:sugar phosphate isomerase/epimerase family protein [Candidatus Limnocylindrales bacterium]